MTTVTALPAIARVGVAPGWHAPTSTTAPAVAHLLPSSRPDDGRATQPALCGQRRSKWMTAEASDRALRPCERCLAAAEQLPAVRAVVRIAPSAPRAEQVHGRISDPPLPSTLSARLDRRAGFRDVVPGAWLAEAAYEAEVMAELHQRERRAWFAPPAFVIPGVDDPDDPDDPDELDDAAPGVPDPHRPLAYTTST